MKTAMPQTEAISSQEPLTRYMPFMLELRKRLLFVVSIFVASGILGFIFYQKVINLSLKIFALEGVNIVFTSPFQFLNLAVTSGLLISTLVIFPLIILQVLSFLKPALNNKEYRTITSLLPLSILLFTAGFGFGVVIMRYVIRLFYQKSVELQIGNFLDISTLLSQILLTSVLMGLAFQFPIVLTILIKLKVLRYRTIEKQRLWAYTASLIFATLLPPTDLLSLFFLFLPLALLFELTLLLNRWVLKAHLL